MIGLHLLYVQLLGRRVGWMDVGVFAASVFAAFVAAEFVMTLVFFDSAGLEIAFDALLVVTMMVFAVFTVYPPHHWLFRER